MRKPHQDKPLTRPSWLVPLTGRHGPLQLLSVRHQLRITVTAWKTTVLKTPDTSHGNASIKLPRHPQLLNAIQTTLRYSTTPKRKP
jgi:hypothetical protein